MDRGIFNNMIQIAIKDNGQKVNKRVLGYSFILMAIYMKDIGQKESKMDKEQKSC